jgi:hypothetical protein
MSSTKKVFTGRCLFVVLAAMLGLFAAIYYFFGWKITACVFLIAAIIWAILEMIEGIVGFFKICAKWFRK